VQSKRIGHAARALFRERALRVNAGYLEEAVIELAHAQDTQSHALRNLYVPQIVYAEAPGLLYPVLYERVAQGMFGFRLRQESAFNYETVFASFAHGTREDFIILGRRTAKFFNALSEGDETKEKTRAAGRACARK
jgi:hypothetical protein